ncbi:MAG: hypothetical protein EOP62_20810 [Sphingomonadales bacterium]|nr:MAG: hypothetical protein EOP62_20810 [Sphingomonadales bacterium]
MASENQQDVEFERLIQRRRKFIEGLEANRGEINLDIFEDFYPDKAHFVYELLQNAEDAGATEVAFTLLSDRLICDHDGRAFTLADVTSITGLHDSTKASAKDKIGKFGVGFKSVFVYTQAPVVRSGDFSFQITQLILPEPKSQDVELGGRTRFELPLDNPKKPIGEAFAEIASGLKELDEKTLLFLSRLQSVRWKIEGESGGEILRVQHSDFHYETLKEVGGKAAASSHFLKFEQAVPGLDTQRVALAFPLDLLPGAPQFDASKTIARQLKVIAAEPGCVAVFFPAVKETSGLRFHLHGPFVPELSRASVKETDVNLPLFDLLAGLAASSLHEIRNLGLLSADFLAVLPNPQDQIPPRYQGIRTAILEEMKSQPLTPTFAKGHAPATRLIQARASLKELLSESDIEFLVSHEGEPPLWAIGAAQRNSRIDNLLTGLGIREWGLAKFLETLRNRSFRPSDQSSVWMMRKPSEWFQQFYALLNAEAGHELFRLKSQRIVLMSDASLGRGDQTFFANGATAGDVPVVDKGAYSAGNSKSQQDAAKAFLTDLGVRDIGAAEQVEIILRRRYTLEAKIPDDATYLKDLKRFISLVEKDADHADLFEDFYIFQGGDGQWYKPCAIYLDRPYLDTDLSAYHSALSAKDRLEALHPRYLEIELETKRIGAFASAVGASDTFEIRQDTCYANPEWDQLSTASGNWTSYGINRDFHIPHLQNILEEPSLELSRLIWKTISALTGHSGYWTATYRCNSSHPSRTASSRLVHELRTAKWIPQGDGVFVRPAEASRELLPKGFAFDPGYAWLKILNFGAAAARISAQAVEKDNAAKALGFTDAAEADRARQFSELPEDEQTKILAEIENRKKSAIPDRPLANPEQRAKRVREQALNAPDKQSEVRERSVSIGREDVKEQADSYLREHYRNADGELTCQLCKGPLPFKLEDGREYFEVVEFLPELTKRHPQNYLALCPNHSAMFRFVNGSRRTLRDDFRDLFGNELAVVLADRDMSLYFSKTHIVDLKAVLDAEEGLAEIRRMQKN